MINDSFVPGPSCAATRETVLSSSRLEFTIGLVLERIRMNPSRHVIQLLGVLTAVVIGSIQGAGAPRVPKCTYRPSNG